MVVPVRMLVLLGRISQVLKKGRKPIFIPCSFQFMMLEVRGIWNLNRGLPSFLRVRQT